MPHNASAGRSEAITLSWLANQAGNDTANAIVNLHRKVGMWCRNAGSLHGSSPPGNSVGWLLGSSPPNGLMGTSPSSSSSSLGAYRDTTTSGTLPTPSFLIWGLCWTLQGSTPLDPPSLSCEPFSPAPAAALEPLEVPPPQEFGVAGKGIFNIVCKMLS